MHIDSLDITLDAAVAVACGGSESKGLLVAFSFDGHFDFVNKLEFDEKICKVKRLTKSDTFLVGGWRTLFLTRFADRKMSKLGVVQNISEGLIAWIEVVNNQVFTLDQMGAELRRITFCFDIENYTSDQRIDLSN